MKILISLPRCWENGFGGWWVSCCWLLCFLASRFLNSGLKSCIFHPQKNCYQKTRHQIIVFVNWQRSYSVSAKVQRLIMFNQEKWFVWENSFWGAHFYWRRVLLALKKKSCLTCRQKVQNPLQLWRPLLYSCDCKYPSKTEALASTKAFIHLLKPTRKENKNMCLSVSSLMGSKCVGILPTGWIGQENMKLRSVSLQAHLGLLPPVWSRTKMLLHKCISSPVGGAYPAKAAWLPSASPLGPPGWLCSFLGPLFWPFSSGTWTR